MALMKLVNWAALAGERVDSDRFNTGAKRSQLVKNKLGTGSGAPLATV